MEGEKSVGICSDDGQRAVVNANPWEQRKFSDIAARESFVSTSASDIPSVEYEDVVAEEGRLNKDIRLKEAVKSGITFDGSQSTEMVKEFFYAISYACGMNLHIRVLAGGNNHHVAEAMFKSFAKALDAATSYDPRITDVLSTKGSL